MKGCINVYSKSWFVWHLWAGGLLDITVLQILECPIIIREYIISDFVLHLIF